MAAKDGNGALRPKTDAGGRLVGLGWGVGLVIPAAAGVQTGRRGGEQTAEIEGLIAAGKVRSVRIVRTVIDGCDTYRMQLVCDGRPGRRHPVGEGRVSFDLGPSQIAVAVACADGCWLGWTEPLGLNRQHRAGSRACFDRDAGGRVASPPGWASQDVAWCAGQPAVGSRRRGVLREAGLRGA